MDFGSTFFLMIVAVAIAVIIGFAYYLLVPLQRHNRHIKHIVHQPYWKGIQAASKLVRSSSPEQVGDCYFWEDDHCMVRLQHEGLGHENHSYEGSMAIYLKVRDSSEFVKGKPLPPPDRKELVLYSHGRRYGWTDADATISQVAQRVTTASTYAMQYKLWPLYFDATRKALVT